MDAARFRLEDLFVVPDFDAAFGKSASEFFSDFCVGGCVAQEDAPRNI